MDAVVVIRLVSFLILTGAFAWVSREHLRDRSSYGFYRFFAFAGIFALTMLNAGRWFVAPASARQILSWILLAASALLAAHGLRLHRRARGSRGNGEEGPVLITWGAYRYLRHPLYASLFYFVLGACLKSVNWPSVALTALTSLLIWRTAVVEERENLERFGEPYREWMASRKRFIPWLF